MMPRIVYAARTRISENCVGWLAWCWPDPTDVAVRDEERPSWPAIRWSIESPQRHEEECLRDMKKSVSETERL